MHLWILEEHLFVLFYVTSFLVRKSFQGSKNLVWYNSTGTVINWQAWSLVSLEVLWRLTGLLVTLRFSSQTRQKAFPNIFVEYYQRKKIGAIKRSDVLVQGPVMLCLYYYVFLMSSYFLKMSLLAMFGKLMIVLLELRLCFETAVKQSETS